MSEISYYNQNQGIEFLDEIQDFGYLIGISKDNYTIEFVSENISKLFSVEAQSILNKPILEFIDLQSDIELVNLLPKNLLDKILKLTQADGIAYVRNDFVTKFGITPASDEILRIKNWAIQNEISDLYYSNSFYKQFKDLLEIQSTSGGVLFKFLDNNFNNFIIWFKKIKSSNEVLANKIKYLEEEERNSKIIKYSTYSDYETWLLKTEFLSSEWSENDLYVVKEILNVILESIHVKSVKIRDLYEQLKEINAELDSFSYTISHDLKTPLTVMKLNCQLLLRKLNDELKSNQVKEIIKEIDHISEMMHEILLLSKAKKSEINLISIDPSVMINKIINDAKIYYESEKSIVNCGELLPILADKTMAFEIFLNVINNAIKYSSKNIQPRVDIVSEEKNNKIIYYISDNGIGIKPEDKHKMFKLFSRMSNTSGFRGNGVGLSIVHRMMERLDGEISYESMVNEGTTFKLVFQKP